jgi:Secretion system C-terminal sorting domain/GEVED domain
MVINQPYTGGLPNKAVIPITGNVTIPTTAKLGTTCMRVSFRQNIAPTPCDVWSNSNGEVEDYSVAITSNFQALVSIGNLKAQLIEQKARLDWTRRSDKIAYFEVEKSTNGRDFVVLQKVFTNPNDVYHYIFDTELVEGDNYYQLKIVQLDGTIDYTPIQQLFHEKMFDFTVFPNPAKDEVWIDLKAFEGRNLDVILSDIAGKVIHTEKVEKATAAPHRLDVSSIESGAYFITIQTSGKRTVVRKVSIMK